MKPFASGVGSLGQPPCILDGVTALFIRSIVRAVGEVDNTIIVERAILESQLG
jgi:hypothetical protein